MRIVTSWSPRGHKQYGKNFLRSFRANWPSHVTLRVYYEGEGNNPAGSDGRDLLQVRSCSEFLSRHKNDLTVCGKEVYQDRFWKGAAIRNGYNFRFDAYKFARKVFAIADCAREMQWSGKLFWIDGDVQTIARVPDDFLNRMLPDDAAVSYLARPDYHSECGFVGFELSSARKFIETFERIYDKDEFFDYQEWHDSWVFDRVLEKIKPPTFRIPHSSRSQPFDHSPLALYMRHYKGSRKEIQIRKGNR